MQTTELVIAGTRERRQPCFLCCNLCAQLVQLADLFYDGLNILGTVIVEITVVRHESAQCRRVALVKQ